MIIDFHTHIFPAKVVDKALLVLRAGNGNVQPQIIPTVDELRKFNHAGGIDASVVLPVATRPDQERSINDFAISVNSADIIAFGSVHPDSKNALSELERIKDAGLKGIKLHPDNQDFFAADKKAWPIYQKCKQLGLIVLFHAGIDFTVFEPIHCPPQAIAEILPVFEGSPVVAAHLGGYLMWYDVEKYLVGKDVYFDTAYCYSTIPKKHALRICQNHGMDKVLLGSDMPWSSTLNEIAFIDSWGLDEADKAQILGGNAMRLLGL